MRRECRERFPRHWLQRKPLVSDPGMHHSTCVMHVPWSMSGSLTHGGRKNVPGVPGAYLILNFTYLIRSPWHIEEMFKLQSFLTKHSLTKTSYMVCVSKRNDAETSNPWLSWIHHVNKNGKTHTWHGTNGKQNGSFFRFSWNFAELWL